MIWVIGLIVGIYLLASGSSASQPDGSPASTNIIPPDLYSGVSVDGSAMNAVNTKTGSATNIQRSPVPSVVPPVLAAAVPVNTKADIAAAVTDANNSSIDTLIIPSDLYAINDYGTSASPAQIAACPAGYGINWALDQYQWIGAGSPPNGKMYIKI